MQTTSVCVSVAHKTYVGEPPAEDCPYPFGALGKKSKFAAGVEKAEQEATKQSGMETERVLPWNEPRRRPKTFGNHDAVAVLGERNEIGI